MTTTLPFEFAVGIECTLIIDERPDWCPPLRRLEEFELMRHYQMWREDLNLVAKLRTDGHRVTKLRWCFPWYRMEPVRGQYDFSWTDEVVEYATQLGIELVPDIIHYGTPDWLGGAYGNTDYPDAIAAFAGKCAERYKGAISCYTPFNEPGITCMFSAERGEWPPFGKSEAAYVQVMMRIAAGVQKTVQAIKAADSNAQCWAVEAMNNYRKALNKGAEPTARKALLRDLVCWDLVHGKVDEKHESYSWLLQEGAAEKELQFLVQNPIEMDVLGVNFYPWQSKTVEENRGEIVEEFDATGALLFDLLRDCHQHTGAKMFVTETSAHGGGGSKSSAVLQKAGDTRAQWMDGTIAAVAQARREGLPVLGYTQFPLFTMVDWAYRLDTAPAEDYFLNLGMIEVHPESYERLWTPVADRFLHHLRTFEQVAIADCRDP